MSSFRGNPTIPSRNRIRVHCYSPRLSCLRNVVALFHVLEKEMEWRKSKGLPEKFGNLRNFQPVVAVGAEHALEDEILMADHFRKFLQKGLISAGADND